MTKIKLLKAARQKIKSGKHRFICAALRNVNDGEDSPECDYLITWIKEMLGSSYTLDSWLLQEHGIPYSYSRKYRQTRLAWIDWMIKELEK